MVVAAAVGLLIVVVLAAVVTVDWAPERLADTEGLMGQERAAEIRSVRTALLAFLAGALGASTALFTGLSWRQNRRGQITERFTRAIDQLGTGATDVKLGGIYALEQIARESRVEHAQVMEVLLAFVREHSSWPPPASESGGTAGERAATPVGEPPEASAEVKAVLTILAHRHRDHERIRPVRWDLAGTNMRGIRAPGIWLEGADLMGAQLQGAWLQGAHLGEADLRGAQLTRAQLQRADLKDARYDNRTTWPHDVNPDERGARPETRS